MNDKINDGFSYTYSAKEQEEIRRIRNKYAEDDKEEDKMERLRRLDAGVVSRAQTVALIFGVLGVLALGFGMSLFMSELGENLGFSHLASLIVGVVSGLLGGTLACFAYPIYNFVLRRERKKIAPEIIRLTDELMK